MVPLRTVMVINPQLLQWKDLVRMVVILGYSQLYLVVWTEQHFSCKNAPLKTAQVQDWDFLIWGICRLGHCSGVSALPGNHLSTNPFGQFTEMSSQVYLYCPKAQVCLQWWKVTKYVDINLDFLSSSHIYHVAQVESSHTVSNLSNVSFTVVCQHEPTLANINYWSYQTRLFSEKKMTWYEVCASA